MGGKSKDITKTKEYKTLRKALLENLALRGVESPVYTDKVDEYMDFWVRRCQLRNDIRERGVTVMDDRGRVSENRSISLEIQASKQMLSIFQALGFKPEEMAASAGADDDEL